MGLAFVIPLAVPK